MILVTGASGFVGSHLVRALRLRFPNEPIRAFDVKVGADYPEGVMEAQGSVEDASAVAEAVRGARIVVHLAAFVQPNARAFDKMWRVNVDGSRNIYAAAIDEGCQLFLHLSSAGVYGHPHQPRPFVETDPANPTSPYQRTKWEAEESLREMNAKNTTLNVVRPAGIYGSGSHLELDTYKRVLSKRWAVELPGGIVVHPTHVRDVVHALLAMMDAPAPHKSVFNVGGEQALRLQDLEALIALALGTRRKRITIPPPFTGAALSVADPLLEAVGRPNPLRKGIGQGRLFSSAVNDSLFRNRYPLVPRMALEEGLREHLAWAVEQNLLAPPAH